MAAPWLKYQQAAQSDGPWTKYAQAQPSAQPAPVMVGDENAATMPAWKNAAYGLVSPVADAIVGVGQMTGLMDDKTARESLARIDAVRSRTPGKVAGIAGDIGTFALAPESKVAEVPRLARVARTALTGAAYAGLQGTRDGESRTENAAWGAGLNVLGGAAADKLQSAGQRAAAAIKPEVRAVWDKARALGIDLTPAQLSDSAFLRTLSSTLNKLPLSGGVSRARQQVGQWNQQLAKAIGVDAPVVTPEVYAAKKAADSAGFDALTARNNLTVTPDLARNLHTIAQQAKVAGVGDQVANAIEGLYSQMQDGVVPGRAYQALDSILGKATKAGDTGAHFVGMVRTAIQNAMDASISPEDSAAWKQLRREYANRKTITPLVAKADGGPISPAQLKARVTATNAGKERMASGAGGLMGDLADVGQRMKDGVPDSGTAQRMLIYHGLGLLGGGYAATSDNPLIQDLGLLAAGGAVGGRVVNSNRLARVLMRDGRGQVANRLAPVVARAPLLAWLAQQQTPDGSNGP